MTSSSVIEAALRAADAVADAFLEGRHIPGVAYGVVAGGELIHSRGLGTLRVGEVAVPDADSVFRIASMTKSFTAATVLSLRDEGRYSLDDPIERYVLLPELRGPTTDSPPITIRHLLSMTSGLATDDPWGDRQQGLDLDSFSGLLQGPFTFAWAPGTRFEYSNLGYGILGRLITNVAGSEYRDVVRDRFLGPLGMDATTYLQADVPVQRLAHGYLWRDDAFVEEPIDPYGALASMGGVFTSVRDLAKWIAFFTDAYPPRDDPERLIPLSRASRREMQQGAGPLWPDLALPGLDADPAVRADGYGFGLFIEDHLRWGRIVTHSGGYPGFGSNMRWQPASGLGVIVLANHRYAPSTSLARQLMDSLLAARAVPARPIRPAESLTTARVGIDWLLGTWDDDVAGRLFAMNVDLDEPIAHRRNHLARIRALHGDLHPDPDLPERSDTPLHAAWWLADTKGGRVRIEIRLDPEAPSRVQTFSVTSVPAPSETLRGHATRLLAAINGRKPAVPAGMVLGEAVDQPGLTRAIRIAAARHAPLTLGPAVAGDGVLTATWRLRGDRGELELALTIDPESDVITKVSLVQRPPSAPQHAD